MGPSDAQGDAFYGVPKQLMLEPPLEIGGQFLCHLIPKAFCAWAHPSPGGEGRGVEAPTGRSALTTLLVNLGPLNVKQVSFGFLKG